MAHAQETIGTTELLVAILLEVDERTLLTSAQRVCRHWHAVIASSPALQRALFLQPERQPQQQQERRGGADDETDAEIPYKRQNPLLKDIFSAWFENTCSFTPRPTPGVNPKFAFPATAMMGYKRFRELPLYQASIGETGEKGDIRADNPFLRPGASWRRMLTSQPPCRLVWSNVKHGPGASVGRDPGATTLARYDDGLRMGGIYDIVLRHSSSHQLSGFMIIWPEGGDDNFPHLGRHIKRMSGIVPVASERALRQAWTWRADLLLQMLWTEGTYREERLVGASLGKFWEACGSKLLPDEVDKST